MGAISPSTGRTLPDRFIEGTCPICGYDGARGDQCDNCGNQLDPVDLINPRSRINGETPQFVKTEQFFLDLPALADALGSWLQSRTDWRPNVLKFSLNLLDDLRPRAMTRDIDWGVPVPLPGWEDNPTKRLYVWFDAVIGYLSASIEWARRTGTGDEWRQWWCDPGRLLVLLHGQGQHHVPLPDLARRAARLRRPRGEGRRARRVRPPRAAHRGGVERVPHDGGPQVLVVAWRGHLRQRLPVPVRPRCVALLHRRRRSRDAGHRLHLVRVRTPHQRRARRRLGQPRQPHRLDDRQEHRLDPRSRRPHRGRPGPAGDDGRRVRHGRRTDRPPPPEGGDRRGDARGRRRQLVPVAARAVEAEEQRPGADGDGATRRRPGRRRLQDAARPVPPAHRRAGARTARPPGSVQRPLRRARGRRPRRRRRLSGADGRRRAGGRDGRRRRSSPALRSPRRRRCSPSSTRRSSTTSSPASKPARERVAVTPGMGGQSLPRVRHAARRRARRGGRRRPRSGCGHDDRRRVRPRTARWRRSTSPHGTPVCSPRSGCTRTTPSRDSTRSSTCSTTRLSWPSARRVSTSTTTTRLGTCSARCSPPRSASPTSATSRS